MQDLSKGQLSYVRRLLNKESKLSAVAYVCRVGTFYDTSKGKLRIAANYINTL